MSGLGDRVGVAVSMVVAVVGTGDAARVGVDVATVGLGDPLAGDIVGSSGAGTAWQPVRPTDKIIRIVGTPHRNGCMRQDHTNAEEIS